MSEETYIVPRRPQNPWYPPQNALVVQETTGICKGFRRNTRDLTTAHVYCQRVLISRDLWRDPSFANQSTIDR